MKKKSTRYKNGGTSKNEWISDKISKMLSEGKDLDQSTAIANAMYNSGDSRYQNGSTFIKSDVMTRRDSLDVQKYSMRKNKEMLDRGFILKNQERGVYPDVHLLNNEKLNELRLRQQKNINTQVIQEQGYRKPEIYDPNIYKQDIDVNKYYNQETDIGVLDPRSSYMMFDKRANPTEKSVWMNPITGDGATTYGYDFGENYKPKPRVGKPIKRPTGTKPNLTQNRRPVDGLMASLQYGGIPQYQYAGQNFNVPEPNYYDKNSYFPQVNQPMYSGQYSPPQTQLPSLGDESDMYKHGDNNLDGITNAQDNVDKFGNSVNKQTDQYDKTRFANPYGGFDIPSAAVKFGQGLQSGNGFDIATGGLKLVAGLGRNIALGMGYENRRDWVMNEAQRKEREASRPTTDYQQYGGYFQDGGMQMGHQAPPQEQQDPTQMIAQALQQGVNPQEILQQLVEMGMEESQATQMIQGIMQQMQGQPQEQQAMQMGGQLKKKVIGEHISENEQGEKVAELEDNEKIKTPDGEIREVVGEKHAQGGVKLTEEQLPNGSEIISDHLKVGKSGAKRFNDDYDLGIKSTDTYATILDKFNRKSGIKKIVDEQEIVQKNIEKQVLKLQENPAAESTIKLNLQLFTDQFQELQDQKIPLEEARKVLFDEVFQPQEESKEPNGHNYLEAQEPIPTDNEEYKNGGEKNSLWKNIRANRGSGKSPTKQMLEQEAKIKKGEMGGVYNDGMIIEYSQKHNLHPDRVRELMMQHQNGGLQQYQDGRKFFTPSKYALSGYENQPFTQMTGVTSGNVTDVKDARERLADQYPSLSNTFSDSGLQLDENGQPYFYGTEKINNFQDNYNTYVDTTNSEIDNNPYLTEEQKKSYKETATAQKLKLSLKLGKSDGIYGNETSSRQAFYLPYLTQEDRKKYVDIRNIGQVLDNKGEVKEAFKDLDPKTQQQLKDTFKRQGKKSFDIGLGDIEDKKAFETTSTEDTTGKTDGYTPSGANGKTRYTLANLPDQSPLMPDSLQGALKLNTRYERVETPFLSPDAQITEIRRQEQSAMQGLQGLPDAQRASAIAQIQANSQNALNQAIAQTQGANQQAKFNADASNANTQRAEEDMRNKNLQDYENKITRADTLTQQNLRNYYNANKKVNVGNYNYIQGLDLVNDRFYNAQYNGQGMNMQNLQKAKDYDNFIANNTDYNNYLENKNKIGVLNKANRQIEKGKARFGGKK